MKQVSVSEKTLKAVSYIKPKEKDSKLLDRSFIALDLETRTLASGALEAIYAFDGKYSKTYYLTDFESSNEMLKTMILDLFALAKSSEVTVYIHNFSGFDSIFLLGILADKSHNFELNRREDKIISLKTKAGDSKLVFKDSILLLPMSLENLGKGFNVKGNFDHNKSNLCVTKDDLEAIRAELLNYNIQDCIVLLISKFRELIFDLFSIDILNHSTIASLAFRIYTTNFMPKRAHIPITDLKLYDKLISGYTGGHVDVYHPISPPDNKVFCYDVNSLYPYVMQYQLYPSGPPKFTEGKYIDPLSQHTFGFLKVTVYAPVMNIPFLQTKLYGRTVAPIGKWTG